MKKIILVLCTCLLLTGCGEATENGVDTKETKEGKSENMFAYVQKHNYFLGRDYDIVYCKDTKVMYVVSCGDNNEGNFTLLVNADGSPMLYESGGEE